MPCLHAIAFFLKPLADFFCNHHGSVLATGAAKGNRQIAFALVNVVRQQIEEQAGNAVEKFLRLRKSVEVSSQFRMLSRKWPKFWFEMRIGKKPHIKNKIRFQRHAILISKAERRNQKVFPAAIAGKSGLDVRAEFMHIEIRRVDNDIGNVANRIQQFATLPMSLST